MLNLSSLFFTTADGELCLRCELDLNSEQRTEIANAKNEIRQCLRAGLPVALQRFFSAGAVPKPRFFTQGSWTYKTLNSPARAPQQADVDDGCYLPMSFVTQTQRPSVAASVFFTAAEEVLRPLVEKNRWKLVTDKPTCIRIILARYAHIDVPLYAIPDKEFVTLDKAVMESYGHKSFADALRYNERDVWTALPREKVLLAHRECDWMPSDPRPLKEWFLNEVDARGEQLRRVVRYLKAFRDWKWESGGPSSILLMAAATPLFEKRERRDDLALLDVVAGLPNRLRNGVNNPTDDNESLTDRLGKEKVEEAAKAFEDFEVLLRGALNAGFPSQACIWMRQELGPRFPNEPERIKVASVAATIAARPAATGPSEIVGRTKAG